MTIAACYLSPEGVVFGADSTTTFGDRYYNHAQKLFEIGSGDSTLGIVIWGLGGLGDLSYRTIIRQLSEQIRQQSPANVEQVANQFGQLFWGHYTSRMGPQIMRVQQLIAQAQSSAIELKERQDLFNGLSGGFCLGGNLHHDPIPYAFVVSYNPMLTAPLVQPLPMHLPKFWGQPNLIQRLFAGIDDDLFRAVLQSGQWKGTPGDLLALVDQRRLSIPGVLPIREAIDLIHASLYSTIKAMKFSQMAPTCGGSVEVAVITSDRPFRWVRHKRFDAAIPFDESMNV